MRIFAAVLSLLLLAGCAGFESAGDQARFLQEQGEAYVNDNILRRQQIRADVWNLVTLQVEALRSEGKYEEARAVWCELYPGLVTLGTLRRSEENEVSDALRAIDLEVAGCPPKDPLQGKAPLSSPPLVETQ